MSDHAVEARHTPECSERIVFGGECSCEPDLWVRLSDVIEALRSRRSPVINATADAIQREFGGEA